MYSAALVRQFWCSLALVLGVIFSSSTFADAPRMLQVVYELQLKNFLALNAFYNFSDSMDKASQTEANDTMNAISTLSSELQTEADALKLSDKAKAIRETTTKIKKLLSTNVSDIKKNGYPDLQPVADMANEVTMLNDKLQELYFDVKAIDPKASTERVDKVRFASTTIAKMMTKYSARTTSSVSQIFQGADTEKSIDELAVDFDAMVADLAKSANTDESKTIMVTVNSKWEFLKGSYMNYNENAVPYLINLYSKKIITLLQELVTTYEGA